MKKVFKNLLTIVTLCLLFTTSAIAEKITIDKAEILKIINRYWDICEQERAKKIRDGKGIDEIAKMSLTKGLAHTKLSSCIDSMRMAEKDNKEEYDGKLDMSRNVQLLGISHLGRGVISADYTYYAFQYKNYKARKGGALSAYYRIDFVIRKNPNGTIKYLIAL